MTRIVVLYHWTLCGVLLFLFVFGVISNRCRRLIPLWFSCLLVDWLTMVWLLKGKGFPRAIGAASVCVTALFACLTAFTVTNTPSDSSVWERPDCIYQTLREHGLTHGYSTDYWYGYSVTVVSNEEIISRAITIKNDGFKIPDHMTKRTWYTGTPSDEKTFLICKESVADKNPWLEEDAVEKYYAWQHTPLYDKTDGYYIFVYGHDVIAEKLQESASADIAMQVN